MDRDTGDEPPIDRLFGLGIVAGLVVGLVLLVGGARPAFAVGTALFVAVLVAAAGLAVVGRR
jgi:hypothetical protein